MGTTQVEATTLYWSERGSIACGEHTPFPGSDTRVLGRWQPITLAEAAEFEREVGRAPVCEDCAAMVRNAGERS